MKTRLFILAPVLLLLCAPAWAQKAVPVSPTGKKTSPEIAKLIMELPPEEQEAIAKEGTYAEGYCHDNTVLGNFYDCSCVATRVMEERFNNGPDLDFSTMLLDTDFAACVSQPMAAGYGYKRCVDAMSYIDNVSPGEVERTCQCTGRQLAGNFAARPIADMRYIDAVYFSVSEECHQ